MPSYLPLDKHFIVAVDEIYKQVGANTVLLRIFSFHFGIEHSIQMSKKYRTIGHQLKLTQVTKVGRNFNFAGRLLET